MREKRGINNNAVHAILLEEGLALEELNKRGRKRRGLGMSGSMLSALCTWARVITRRWVVAVLDGCSQRVLAPREGKRRSANTAIAVLEEALKRYRHIRRIREVVKAMERSATRIRGTNRSRSNDKIEKWIHSHKRHTEEFLP